MKNYLLLILSLCFCAALSAQCQFGERYSEMYLNIKKQYRIGDSSVVFAYANGSGSIFTLTEIDRDNNYQYRRDVGYLSEVKIKFDSLGRVNFYYFKYNSGSWGAAGDGTEFADYYENGNVKIKGWKARAYAKFRVYDSLPDIECESGKLILLKEVECIKFRSEWYVLLGKRPELNSPGCFKRRKLIRINKNNLRKIEINWENGFKIDDAIVKEIIGTK